MIKTSLIGVFLTISVSAFAQTIAESYAEVKPVPYLFEHFTKGLVLMKSGATEPASLNYNTEDQTISFEKDGKVMTLTGLSDVDTIFFSNKRFIPAADDRIYEVITVSPLAALYATYYGKLKPATAVADKAGTTHEDAGSASNTISGIYVLRPYKGDFTVEVTRNFRLIRNKQIYKATSERDFNKVFPHHDAEIASYVASHKLKFNNEPDLVKLTEYCNALK